MTDRGERLLQAFLDDLGTASAPAGLSRRVSRRIQDEHPARASRFSPWFVPAAAAVAILALVGFGLIVAAPKPSPTVPITPPSASASASPSAAPSSSASASATPSPSAGSTLVPPPTVLPDPNASPAPSFHVMLDPGGNRLPVLVSDNSASVTEAAAGRPAAIASDPVAIAQGPGPNEIVVSWVGGGCDLLSQVTVDAARTTVAVSTLTTNQGCDAIGIERGVVLTFGQAVNASSIKGQWGSPIYGMVVETPTAVSFTDATHGFLAGADANTGLAYLAEVADTTDRVGFSSATPIGWGTVTGLAVTVDATVSAYPLVAITCPDSPPDPGCLPGIYREAGSHFVRLTGADPAALAARGSVVAALVADAPVPGASYAFPPRKVALSADSGTTWVTVDSPCPDQEATGIAVDASGRPLVVCEGGGAGGEASKSMFRATDASATGWTKLPAPPSAGTGFHLSLAADGTGLMWGSRSPLLVTADGGATWKANAVADGTVRMVEDASALPGGKALILVWDHDRKRVLLLRTTDAGAKWTELAAFPAIGLR